MTLWILPGLTCIGTKCLFISPSSNLLAVWMPAFSQKTFRGTRKIYSQRSSSTLLFVFCDSSRKAWMMNCSWALCSLMTSKHPEPWICGGFRCLHRSVEMLKQSKEQNVGLFPFSFLQNIFIQWMPAAQSSGHGMKQNMNLRIWLNTSLF